MTRAAWALVALTLLTACASTADDAPSSSTAAIGEAATTTTIATTTTQPVPAVVTVERRTYVDPDRLTPHNGTPPTMGRTLETLLWLPSTPGLRPAIVLAHGINGEPDRFDALATSWAEAGFVVAAPRFPASSTTGGAGIAGTGDVINQPGDLTVVIDGLLAEDGLRVDADRIGAAGLSLGGATIYGLVTDTCCADPRVRSAAIFDGLRPGAFPGGTLVPNDVPVLMLHCDEDYLLPYADHAVPGFDRLAAPAWLVTMPCVEHAEPYEDPPPTATPSKVKGLVRDTTLDFWRATLMVDDEADRAALLDRMEATAEGYAGASLEVKG